MKLLVITRHSPLPEWDGAGAYLFDLLAYLAQQGVVIEVAWSDAPAPWRRRRVVRVPARVARIYSLQLPGAWAAGPWRWMGWGSWRARLLHALRQVLAPARAPGRAAGGPAPVRPAWSALPSARERKFFRQRMAAFQPDVVLANYCWLTPALDNCPARTAVLANDVVSQRLTPAAGPATALDPAHAAGESALLSRVPTILAITENDAAVFRGWLPHASVVVTPKAATAHRRKAAVPIRGRCLFVGGLNEPNREGLAWLLEEIWPEIRRQHPHATLEVCGRIASTVAVPPPGVLLTGPLPDLAEAYALAQVALIPLRQGTGMKIKLIEAASHGVPCVTTPVGLQGLEELSDWIVLAAEAREFSAGVCRLLEHPASARLLGAALHNRTVRYFSPERSYGPAFAALFPASPLPLPAPATPAVTVLLPVYNASRYLRTAVTSILRQTWRDLELIAINDGSTDDSGEILDALAQGDRRIVVCHRRNSGLTSALNQGLALARGEFTARMDADDEAAPTRLAAQVARFRTEPELVALGSAITYMDADGNSVKACARPLDHAAIERALLAGDGGALIHPAVMFRTAAVRQVGGYRPEAGYVEDLDLFLRLAQIGRLANLPGRELRYRIHPQSINFTRNAGRHLAKLAVLREAWTVRGRAFDPARCEDGFARHADAAQHHREWSVTALAYGSRRVAIGHGWRAVLAHPFARASWRALRYALSAPMPPLRADFP